MEKMKVGVVGATGMVGQRFLTLLENHPYFEVTALVASSRSAGKTYEEALDGRWKLSTPLPEKYKKMVIISSDDIQQVKALCSFVFCAVNMKKDEIKELEYAYAKAELPVVSNNSAHRWTPDVPMVIPEINPEHLEASRTVFTSSCSDSSSAVFRMSLRSRLTSTVRAYSAPTSRSFFLFPCPR